MSHKYFLLNREKLIKYVKKHPFVRNHNVKINIKYSFHKNNLHFLDDYYTMTIKCKNCGLRCNSTIMKWLYLNPYNISLKTLDKNPERSFVRRLFHINVKKFFHMNCKEFDRFNLVDELMNQ